MKHSKITALLFMTVAATALISFNAQAQKKSTLTDAQKVEIETMMHDYIIANPQVISEAMSKTQGRQQQADRDERQKGVLSTRRDELFKPAEETILGNPKGDVTIVEFFDYACGYCKSMFPAMMETLKEDGKVRLVLKELPILGPNSAVAAKAALAARKQNKYSEFHQAMLGFKGQLSEEAIMQVASSVGLNVTKLKTDMADPAIQQIIDRNQDLARALQVQGTPAMFVNEKFVAGAVDKATLLKMTVEARNVKK